MKTIKTIIKSSIEGYLTVTTELQDDKLVSYFTVGNKGNNKEEPIKFISYKKATEELKRISTLKTDQYDKSKFKG